MNSWRRSEDFGVNTYEGPPFKFKHASKAHSNFANCVRFSPDGERIVSVGSDSKARIPVSSTFLSGLVWGSPAASRSLPAPAHL